MDHYPFLIDGKLVDAANGERFTTIDPSNGRPLATVGAASRADVDAAVGAARRAFGAWSATSPAERADVVMDLADRMQAAIMQLGFLEMSDSGGLLARTTTDVFQGARFMRTMARYASHDFPWEERIPGKNAFFPGTNVIRREPIGVCAAIVPWNFPLLMAVWKVAMALVTGNTLVLKPSPETPLSALALGKIVAGSRVPPGVLNVIAGPDRAVGEMLVRHPQVDRVAFTGSTPVGKDILKNGAETLKRVSLELGGKSANIVLRDADLELAVDGAVWAAFLHTGQVCESGTRLLLPEELHDAFVTRLVEKVRALVVGHPLDPRTKVGPVINAAQRDRIERYVALAKKEGARLACGGERPVLPGLEGGFYAQPTVFVDVDPKMTIAREEIFGPVLSVLRYKSEDEAVAMANDSEFGLAGGVWSRDLERAQSIANRMRTGTVWINDWHFFHDLAPFGGYKQSGIGREMGHHGLAEYTETKHVHVGVESNPDAKGGHRMLVSRGRSLSYQYEPRTRVLSGPGSLTRLHAELDAMGKKRALVVTDPGVVAVGLLTRLREVLGHRIAVVFDKVTQDSGFGLVDAVATAGREGKVDVVISLGGGSCIDTAKATAVALANNWRAIESIGMHHLPGAPMTHIAIPTTAGTGSEVTNVAVIKNENVGTKAYILDSLVAPDLAVLDPTLIVGLPPRLTAATGLDALTHAIEAYTARAANSMSDAQALHAIRLIAKWLPRAVSHGSDLEARTQMQTAATLAGWAISSSTVGLVHAMSHTIGARHGVPHGIGNGILLPHVIRFNGGIPASAVRHVEVAQALGAAFDAPANAAIASATAVETLLRSCDHPTRLSEVGVPKEALGACSEIAVTDLAAAYTARRASPAEIEDLYRTAW
ncbi:MAG TPA: aldehyde dehydrogenase family protein [Polyangiaceae bacterium]|jgi:acyl-CoA reductase-like NAD-dependent aldehyde dehydrogenase/alcohol dehydrogenase class IV|nr:aldehyde dehydrogenase family protein [Polyangiaceae bacterium]